MSRPKKKTEAQKRADNAEGQRKLRAHRSQNGLCLQCGKKAATLPSGLLARQCDAHLKKDRRRKTAARLPPARTRIFAEKPKAKASAAASNRMIPLPWLEDLPAPKAQALEPGNRKVKLSKVAEVTETGDGDDDGEDDLYELPWL